MSAGLVLATLLGTRVASGQAAAEADKPAADEVSDTMAVGVVPLVKGFNVSVVTASQHSSSNGWSNVETPYVAWRFDERFSVDASLPLYQYINVDANVGTKAKPVYQLETKRFVPGDALLNGHYARNATWVNYVGTATLGMPSGNTDYGLGAGQVTYSVNNHFEREVGRLTPDVELGIGDSSSQFGSRVQRSYVAVGTLGYFQAGVDVDLPLRMNLDMEAYEELPIAATTIYSTTGKGKKQVTTATNEGAAEDNGFNTSLDIPLMRHAVLTGFYSRSLRNKIDTAGFSLTFLLRAPKEP